MIFQNSDDVLNTLNHLLDTKPNIIADKDLFAAEQASPQKRIKVNLMLMDFHDGDF